MPVSGSVTTIEPEHGSRPKSPGVISKDFILDNIKLYAVSINLSFGKFNFVMISPRN